MGSSDNSEAAHSCSSYYSSPGFSGGIEDDDDDDRLLQSRRTLGDFISHMPFRSKEDLREAVDSSLRQYDRELDMNGSSTPREHSRECNHDIQNRIVFNRTVPNPLLGDLDLVSPITDEPHITSIGSSRRPSVLSENAACRLHEVITPDRNTFDTPDRWSARSSGILRLKSSGPNLAIRFESPNILKGGHQLLGGSTLRSVHIHRRHSDPDLSKHMLISPNSSNHPFSDHPFYKFNSALFPAYQLAFSPSTRRQNFLTSRTAHRSGAHRHTQRGRKRPRMRSLEGSIPCRNQFHDRQFNAVESCRNIETANASNLNGHA